MTVEVRAPLQTLTAVVHGLARPPDSPLKSLESLNLLIADTSCSMRGCRAKHSRFMAQRLGSSIKAYLTNRASLSMPKLKKLTLSECMNVDGLADLADVVETTECHCPETRRNMKDINITPEGWHDPPSNADWEAEMNA